MRDIENLVITNISNALAEKYPSAEVSGEYVEQPAKFPHVFVLQINKTVNRSYISTSGINNMYDVAFQVIVYSNRLNTAKSECKDIMAIIDDVMTDGEDGMRFRPTYQAHVPNFDSRIYRLVRRYSGTVRQAYDGNTELFIVSPD